MSARPLSNLTAAVQYRRKSDICADWITMAAFDVLGPAETYYAQQRTDEAWPWEYRLIEVAPEDEP